MTSPGIFKFIHFIIFGILVGLNSVQAIADSSTRIEVNTDSHKVVFSKIGATPISWRLTQFPNLPNSKHDQGRIVLESDTSVSVGVAPFSFTGPDSELWNNADYFVESQFENEMTTVKFTATDPQTGLNLTKTYKIPKNGYELSLSVVLTNPITQTKDVKISPENLVLQLGAGWHASQHQSHSNSDQIRVVYENDQGVMHLLELEDNYAGGISPTAWVGFEDRYFLTAVMATNTKSTHRARFNRVSSPTQKNDVSHQLGIEIFHDAIQLAPGDTGSRSYTIFIGPKQQEALELEGWNLRKVQYADLWSWMRGVCLGLSWLFDWVHMPTENWGISIILLALLIRLVLLPVTIPSYRKHVETTTIQAKMRPELKKINEQFKGDAEKLHQETTKLYHEHGISMFSPLMGCLWVFVQIPIFVGLYFVIGELFELRGAEFLWIDNLAAPDRFYEFDQNLPLGVQAFNLLPVLMVVSQILATKTTSTGKGSQNTGKIQQLLLIAFAVVVFVLIYQFPAGVVLYWLVTNLVQIAQQKWVGHQLQMRENQ